MIINIRGTSGSGKSTAVRKVMEFAPIIEPEYIEGRKTPYFYRLRWPGCVISVPGSYISQCGGSDTIKTYDQLFEIVRSEHEQGHHVLFEGLLVAHDKKRCTELWDWLGRKPGSFAIIEIAEPLEVCLSSVEERRRNRPKPPTTPFNPANTIRRYEEVKRSCTILEALSIPIHRCARGQIPFTVFDLLGMEAIADAYADNLELQQRAMTLRA